MNNAHRIPTVALQHLFSHNLLAACPQTNEEMVERLIEHEDAGCKECSSLLDRYIALSEAC